MFEKYGYGSQALEMYYDKLNDAKLVQLVFIENSFLF